ncbi:MAG: DnaD domain protein [Lachnospiraceae bacterium]|nr:DnaD domain protein [Lachnospiraceae bacterium]
MDYINALKTESVVIPSRFITEYMPQAGGDYVKVFLHLLYEGRADVEKMAEDLQLSEGDVKRALKYWEKQGVVGTQDDTGAKTSKETEELEKTVTKAPSKKEALRDRYRSTEGTEALLRLSEDESFRELTLIVQKYRSKIMDEKESQVLAYLYDGLKLPPDVIEYLVSYSVEHDRNDIRYMEKLGCDWAQIGITTVEAAKRRTSQFEENGGRKTGRRSSSKPKASEAKAGHAQERHTDYNELVMKELMENMG